MTDLSQVIVVVGAGPAGLMAAEVISKAGYQVHVYDAMASAGRKFLLAGIGGMNITHSEDFDTFIQRYYEQSEWLNSILSTFNAQALIKWVNDLGIETFVGSSGRVFPKDMKAAPLLRRWLLRLRESGVTFHMKHRLVGLSQLKHQTQLKFTTKDGNSSVSADAVVLAMGGASWPNLGSDGAWLSLLKHQNIITKPLVSANCGFHVNWSDHLKQKFSGSPLKNIAFSFTTVEGENLYRVGECIVSEYGLEGSLVYAFSKYFREFIEKHGLATVHIDLLAQYSLAEVISKLSQNQGKSSLSKHLKRCVGIQGIKSALLYEAYPDITTQKIQILAQYLKALPIQLTQTRPVEEAISSAGGLMRDNFNSHLMLTEMPGVFCAGEMLDWEAPTGGYLLTACFATGKQAGHGVNQYLLVHKPKSPQNNTSNINPVV